MYVNVVSRDGKTSLTECKSFDTIPDEDGSESLIIKIDGNQSVVDRKTQSVYVMNEHGDTIQKIVGGGRPKGVEHWGPSTGKQPGNQASKSAWETGNAKRSHRRNRNS